MPNHIQNRLQFIGDKTEVENVMNSIKGKYDDGTEMKIDFNKIKPMPDGLEANPHSGIETWIKICTGQCDFKSLFVNASQSKSFGDVWLGDKDKGFDNMMNYMETSSAMKTLLGEPNRNNVKDFSDEDFETFIQCLRNYRKYGHISWYKWSVENWGTKWNAYEQGDKRDNENTIHFQTAWSSPIDLMAELSKQFPNVIFKLDYADEDSGCNTGRFVFSNGEALEKSKPENSSLEAYDLFFELHPDRKENYRLVDGKYEYIED